MYAYLLEKRPKLSKALMKVNVLFLVKVLSLESNLRQIWAKLRLHMFVI